MAEFAAYFSLGVSCFGLAYLLAFIYQIKALKSELAQKIVDFNEITRKASEANVSLGEKIMTMDAKLDNIDAWRSMMGINNSSPTKQWKN